MIIEDVIGVIIDVIIAAFSGKFEKKDKNGTNTNKRSK